MAFNHVDGDDENAQDRIPFLAPSSGAGPQGYPGENLDRSLAFPSPAASPTSSGSSPSLLLQPDNRRFGGNDDDDDGGGGGGSLLPEASVLGRHIDWRSAYMIALSRVIGSGIFAVPGVVLRDVGSVGLSSVVWVLGAAAAAAALAVSLEFGCMAPRSGGDKVYAELAWPRPRWLAVSLIAVHSIFLGFTASNCVIFSQYVHFALGWDGDGDGTSWSRKALAVGLITAVGLVHGFFYRLGIRVQTVIGWIKIGLVVFMVVSALWVVVFPPERRMLGTGDREAMVTPSWGTAQGVGLWDGSDWSFGTLSTSLFKVFYAYTGLSNLNNVMNEVKRPIRTLKSVSIAALVTACLLYILVNFAYVVVIPIQEIKASGQLVAALFFERTFGVNIGRRLLPLAVAISAAGNVMVVSFSHARMIQEIARSDQLPLPFLPFQSALTRLVAASTSPFGLAPGPIGALLVHWVPSVLVITLPPTKDVYSFILDVEGYPGQMLALALSVGLLLLRRRLPDLKRPFRAWLPAVIFRMGLSVALLAAPFFPPTTGSGPGNGKKQGGMWYAAYAVVGVATYLFGFLYWLSWAVILPRIGGYALEERAEVLDDGTTITTFVRIPNVTK